MFTTTGKRVFDLTMGLIDEVNENNGATDTADTKEYKVRTPYILNVLRGELYYISDTFNDPEQEAGKRPICPVIEDLEQIIDLDDFVAQTILPYGLAAHLLLQEDTVSANYFQQRYDELKAKYGSAVPANGSESIENVYSGCGCGIEYGWFSRW